MRRQISQESPQPEQQSRINLCQMHTQDVQPVVPFTPDPIPYGRMSLLIRVSTTSSGALLPSVAPQECDTKDEAKYAEYPSGSSECSKPKSADGIIGKQTQYMDIQAAVEDPSLPDTFLRSDKLLSCFDPSLTCS